MQGSAGHGAALADQLAPLFSALVRAGTGSPKWRMLTSTQRLVLLELVDSGPLRLGPLAERAGATDPTTSRAVDGLVDAGLVARKADPVDRRAVLHEATTRGRAAAEARRREIETVLDEALAGFAPAERRRLVDLLARLNEALNAGASVHRPALLATR
ncbi:MAG: MarR family winged helix-turn-helix transcriptional regulator [Verrucomicrobiota bacterium]